MHIFRIIFCSETSRDSIAEVCLSGPSEQCCLPHLSKLNYCPQAKEALWPQLTPAHQEAALNPDELPYCEHEHLQ